MKKGRYVLILCAILGLGFLARGYHLNFPSIGYHNMKENEALIIAQEMQRTGDYLNQRLYFQEAFSDKAGIIAYTQVPMVSYQILLAWKALDENLWGPRLVNILFGTAAILLVYLICLILFVDSPMALLAAFLAAIMPLGVFFSRNLQPESPAFFFMLLGNLFYLRFIRSRKDYNLIAGGASFVAAWLYQNTFLIGLVPFAVCFPYHSLWKERPRCIRTIFSCAVPFALIPGILFFLYAKAGWRFQFEAAPLMVFSPAYWKQYGGVLRWFITGENFTWLPSLLAVCGVCLALFKRHGLLNRYLAGWIAAVFVYAMLFPLQLPQNSFLQMPFLAAVCIAAAYAVSFMREELRKASGRDFLIPVAIMITALSAKPVYESLVRMHGTVYLGEDAAGETLRELTQPAERVFLLTHAQGYGVARYARRYAGWPSDIEDFKAKERSPGVRFVCLYPGELLNSLKKDSPAIYDYLQTQYHVREVGLVENLQKMGYLILEKGPSADKRSVDEHLSSVEGKLQPRSIYKLFGRYVFFYALRPEQKKE